MKLGMRKSGGQSESSEAASRDRSTNIAQADIGVQPSLYRSIEEESLNSPLSTESAELFSSIVVTPRISGL